MEAGKIRPGSIFKLEGSTFEVIEFQHVKQARAAGFIRAKIKNVETGGVKEWRFNPTEVLENADVTSREMEFSFNVDKIYTFMDMQTFDQVDVDYSLVKDALAFHTDGTRYTFTFLDGKIISVTPPTFVVLEIIETEPSVAGDTARNAMKNAKLESGLTIKVPMFVNNHDKVKVDTRNSTYVERA